MSSSLPIAAVTLTAATLFLAAVASAASAPAARDPLDPRAGVPPLRHSSAFAGYRSAQDPAPTDWREANDTTARVGGWRAYARQAQAGDAQAPAADAAPAAASQPAAGPATGAKPPQAAPAGGGHHGH